MFKGDRLRGYTHCQLKLRTFLSLGRGPLKTVEAELLIDVLNANQRGSRLLHAAIIS